MPENPFGANGVQFTGLTKWKLTKTKNPSTTSLIATIQKLNDADSRIPQTSTTVIAATIANARMLRTIGTPKTCGAAATTSGILECAVW